MPGDTSRSDPDRDIRQVGPLDPLLEPLVAGLMIEFTGRYPEWRGGSELDRFPSTDWDPPEGAFLVLVEAGETVAGGAFRKVDATTAELKRVWTSTEHRRQGLARQLVIALERLAAERGYERIHLSMGPRQPEAMQLFLASGYTPLFDVDEHPLPFKTLHFEKVIVPAP